MYGSLEFHNKLMDPSGIREGAAENGNNNCVDVLLLTVTKTFWRTCKNFTYNQLMKKKS